MPRMTLTHMQKLTLSILLLLALLALAVFFPAHIIIVPVLIVGSFIFPLITWMILKDPTQASEISNAEDNRPDNWNRI